LRLFWTWKVRRGQPGRPLQHADLVAQRQVSPAGGRSANRSIGEENYERVYFPSAQTVRGFREVQANCSGKLYGSRLWLATKSSPPRSARFVAGEPWKNPVMVPKIYNPALL